MSNLIPLQLDLNTGNIHAATITTGGSGISASVTVTNFPSTQEISAASLPLPSGAATSDNQINGNQLTRISNGTTSVAIKSASTPATTTDPALVVAISPNNSLAVAQSGTWNINSIASLPSLPSGSNSIGSVTISGTPTVSLASTTVTNTVAVSATSLPLPIGAATSANQTNGNQLTLIGNGTTNVAIKTASTAAVSADPALVVAISPNNTIPVSVASLPLPSGAATSALQSSILAAIQATVNLDGTVWFDPTTTPPTYYVRRETVNEGTGVVTVSWFTPGGSAASPVVANLQAVSDATNIATNTETYVATSGGTGYTTGDILIHTFGINTTQSSPTLAYAFWLNAGPSATGIISAPTNGTYTQSSSGVVSVSNFPSTQTVAGTVTANAGTGTFAISAAALPLPTGAATNAILTGGTQLTAIGNGTTTAALKAASTAAVAADPALVVAISPNNTVPVSQTSSGSATGGTAGTTSNLAGGISNTGALSLSAGQQSALQLDASGYLKVNVVAGGGGGSNAAASATGSAVPASASYTAWNSSGNNTGVSLTTALPVQPGTGATFPVSQTSSGSATGGTAGTTSNLAGGISNTGALSLSAGQQSALQLDASGYLKVNVSAGSASNAAASATGSAVPAAASYTAWNSGGNNTGVSLTSALPVQPGTGATFPVSATALPLPTGAATSANQTNGTQLTAIGNGTTTAALKAASTAAVATDPALVVAISPNNTVAISAASLPLPTGAATNAILTGGTQLTAIGNGTNTAAIKAASTAAAATDPALVVAISPNNTVPVSQTSSGSATGGTAGTASNLAGGISNTGALSLSAGQQASLQLDASGYLKVNVVAGSASNAAASATGSAVPASASYTAWNSSGNNTGVSLTTALPVQPGTGATFPVSAASLPLPTGAATSANQTNGTQLTAIGNGTSTAAIKAASTAAVATDPALVVAISPNNTVAISAASLPLPTGAATSANQTNGTQLTAIGNGTSTAAIKAASTAAVATDPALVVAISPNNTVAISAAALPLPTGAATNAILTGGTQVTLIGNGTTNAALKAASTAAVAADPALVVAISPNNTVPVSQTSSGSATGGTAGTTSNLAGGISNTGALTLTAGQQSALQLDTSGYLKVNVVAGSAANAAASATGSAVPASASYTAWNSSGNNTGVSLTTALPVQPGTGATFPVSQTSSGSATGGTAGTTSNLAGGISNTGALTLTAGQQASLQLDASGYLKVNVVAGSAANAAASATGSAVPAAASYTAWNSSGNNTGVSLTTALPVQPGTGATFPVSAASLPLPTGAATSANQTNGTQLTAIGNGTSTAAIKAASTAAVATDPALVVAISPNNTVAISAAALPLPTGAATNAILTGGTQVTLIGNGTTNAALKAASTAAVAADPALVVAISPNNTVAISAAALPLPSGAATSANQTNGTQLTAIGNGTNTVAIKAASTAAVAADPSLVVGFSPNSPLPAGTNLLGSVNIDIGGTVVSATNPIAVYDAYSAPASVTWTSATALNTADTVTVSGYDTVIVTIAAAAGLTGGVVTFEVYDGTNWIPVKAAQTASYATNSTFTLSGSPATTAWQVPVAGFPQFRVRLSTVIVGSGNVVVSTIISSAPDVSVVTVGLDPSAPLPAGTNVIGGITTQTSQITEAMTVTASAYTAGYVLGGIIGFPAILGALGSGMLQSIYLTSKSVQTTGIQVAIFNANPSGSTFTDHAAPSIAAADIPKLEGVYTLGTANSALGTVTIWNLDSIGKSLNVGGTELWAVVLVTGTPTPASTSDFSLTMSVLKDG